MGGREKYLPEWMEGGIEGAAMHSVYRGSVCTGEGLVWNEAPPQRMRSTLRGTASAYAQYKLLSLSVRIAFTREHRGNRDCAFLRVQPQHGRE